jgi:hypothetical protein
MHQANERTFIFQINKRKYTSSLCAFFILPKNELGTLPPNLINIFKKKKLSVQYVIF